MGCLVVSDSLRLHGWQIPLPLEFSRQEYWDVVPFSPPRDLPDPGVEHVVLSLLHWQVDFLPLMPPGKPNCVGDIMQIQSH